MQKKPSMTTLGAIATPGTRLLANGMVSILQENGISSAHSVQSGISNVMASSKTLATEVVSNEPELLVFKMQQEYTLKIAHFSKKVNSLVSLTLDDQMKVKYHKDMWNQKDYSHEGLGKIMKTLNGDQLTHITRPPDSL